MEFEDAFERHQRIVKAAEDWSKQYEKDPVTHAGIIKLEARLERILRAYFKGLSERAENYIFWYEYDARLRQLQAAADFKVDVVFSDDAFEREDQLVMEMVFDPAAAAIALGAAAGEEVYQVELGLSETAATIQRAAKELVAELVGKRVTKEGLIIDNPNAKYHIHAKTKADILESVSTSLSLGEDHPAATKRMQQVITDPKRAAMIARTEAVNAYQKGLLIMADESGAIGKVWLSVNPNDICGVYAQIGAVRLDYVYDPVRNLKAPAAHPNCRCSLRLMYTGDPLEDKIGKGTS